MYFGEQYNVYVKCLLPLDLVKHAWCVLHAAGLWFLGGWAEENWKSDLDLALDLLSLLSFRPLFSHSFYTIRHINVLLVAPR